MKPIIYDGVQYTAKSTIKAIDKVLQGIDSIDSLFDYCYSLTSVKGGSTTATGGYIEFVAPNSYIVLVTVTFINI